MMKRILLLTVFIVVFSSCTTQRKILYLQDNVINTEMETIKGGEVRLKTNDEISIFASSKNPELTSVFKLPRVQQTIGGSYSNSESSEQNGVLEYTVDFLNLTFSTMCEVSRPSNCKITKDKTTILEALSMSGDLTINGVRDRVFHTRKLNDKLITYQLDIKSTDRYQSPDYYVQQDDMIYI